MNAILVPALMSAAALLATPSAYERQDGLRLETCAPLGLSLHQATGLAPDILLSADVTDAEGRAAGRIERLDISQDGEIGMVWLSLPAPAGQIRLDLGLPIERFAYDPATGRLVADAGLDLMLEWAVQDAAEDALAPALAAAEELHPARHL